MIDGGSRIDTVTLTVGGVLRESETLQTRNVEVLNLIEGSLDITLSNELIVTSDDISATRFFTVTTGSAPFESAADTAGNVTDLITLIQSVKVWLTNSDQFHQLLRSGHLCD